MDKISPIGLQDSESLLEVTAKGSQMGGGRYGDKCGRHNGKFLRIIGFNTRGLPHYNTHEKDRMLREFINQNEPDVICLHEVNVAW